MEIDLSEYMGAYVEGCRENLDTMDKMLLSIEQNPANKEAIQDIFRAAHTLKGMSATMGFEKIAHLTHEMENILDKMRNGSIAVTPEVVDVLFETFDVLRTLINDSIDATDSKVDLSAVSSKLQKLEASPSAAKPSQSSAPAPAQPQLEVACEKTASVVSSVKPDLVDEQALSDLAEMDLSDLEITGLEEAAEKGNNIAILTISLIDDCLLKGSRVFMIMRAFEEYECTVLRAIPSLKDLEDENFEKSFKMLVKTKQDLKDMCLNISKISEVEQALYADLRPLVAGSSAALPPVPPPKQPAPAPVKPATPAPVRPVETPSVSKTVASPAAKPVPEPIIVKEEPKVEIVVQQTAQPIINPASVNTPKPESAMQDGDGDSEERASKENTEIIQFVTFTMADEVYALEIKQVEAIINVVAITRVPKAPRYIDGVINLRGEIVPVINTRRRLKLKETPIKPSDQIIILSFEQEKVKAGFLVDSVQEVTGLAESAIEPPNRVSESVDVEYLRGVGKVDGKIIILLNANRIVFEKLKDSEK
ncbi:MAG: chemotaxis protein CheW [Candidatus Riflebacteria bacterium]|nr:chemotaxis protein CheW [Candidatus Riflebacteria bacterium]